MPTNRTALRRPRRGRMTCDQELEMWLGPARHRPPAFRSEEERRELWFRHRDRLLALFGQQGRRPLAWWRYEAPLPYPGDDNETAALYEAGLLGADELNEVLSEWRRQFEKAQEPAFTFCVGHAKEGDTFATWLKGAAAKRAHYRWAGIPSSLIRKWTEERQRREQVIAS
jgi:hypothetical protein